MMNNPHTTVFVAAFIIMLSATCGSAITISNDVVIMPSGTNTTYILAAGLAGLSALEVNATEIGINGGKVLIESDDANESINVTLYQRSHNYMVWEEVNLSAYVNTRHVLGNFTPNMTYGLWINAALNSTVTANSSGEISFNYSELVNYTDFLISNNTKDPTASGGPVAYQGLGEREPLPIFGMASAFLSQWWLIIVIIIIIILVAIYLIKVYVW